MTMKRLSVLFGLTLAMLCAGWPVFAQSDADEARMQAMQREAEEDAAKRGQKTQAELLARQFQLPVGEVEKLRNAGQGWGEITIRLALADQLVKTSTTEPKLTFAEALERVGALRSDGKGWGQIAKELGFKLGPVVSDIRRSLNDLRRDLRGGQAGPGRIDKADNRGDIKREARAERVERMQRPERPERPQRPERPERPEKPERGNR
jgi:hypothetical protein